LGFNGKQLDGLRLEGLPQPHIKGAAGCPAWMCGMNGTQRDGLRLEGLQQPTPDSLEPVSGKVRIQAEKRLEQQRKDLIRNWGG
jgi:hypothetical protein